MARLDLGRAAHARRKVELGISQQEVRDRTGLSVTTIKKIEHGEVVNRSSVRRLDAGLEWRQGTAESWLEGRGGVVDEPEPSPEMISGIVALVVPEVLSQLSRQGESYLELAARIGGLPAPLGRTIDLLVAQINEAMAGSATSGR